jgi:hypothetical protein
MQILLATNSKGSGSETLAQPFSVVCTSHVTVYILRCYPPDDGAYCPYVFTDWHIEDVI